MRTRSLAIAGVAFAVLAAPSAHIALADPAEPARPGGQRPAAGPSAEQLLEKVKTCDDQISNGEYATDDGGSAEIPVCGKSGAVHWKADLDVVCDGQESDKCNSSTDPNFLPETAWTQSDGQPLDSADLPHIVVPLPSDIWDPADSGIENGVGNVAAVIYNGKVVYGVVGDKGPDNIIGEASYAMAEALGANPDPASGGVDASEVTYIVFPDEKVDPIEDKAKAKEVGERQATKFVEAR